MCAGQGLVCFAGAAQKERLPCRQRLPWRGSAPSPRHTPEEPWGVTYYMSGLTSQFYWCTPIACEEDLELHDLPCGGYAYRVGNACRVDGDGPWLQGDVASAPFGKVLGACEEDLEPSRSPVWWIRLPCWQRLPCRGGWAMSSRGRCLCAVW